MINFSISITRGNYEQRFTPALHEVIQLNETDYVDFYLDVTKEHFENGEPYIVVGDVPYELELLSSSDDVRRFKTPEPFNKHRKQVFYNYFGESEISLSFTNSSGIYRLSKVDIRARKANATLAQDMISFISDNLNDMHMLCFSKSHVSGGIDKNEQDDINRLNLLKDAVSFIVSKQALFIKDHRYTWEHEMTLSQQGQPTGPDSVHYLLTHLDELTPVNNEQANVLVNGRSYRSVQTPQESIIHNADVFENRVIYSFLYSALQYLMSLKKTCLDQSDGGHKRHITVTDDSEDFVSFDHALKYYKSNILLHHVKEIDALQLQIKHIIHLYDKHIKVKLVPHLRPKLTAFVTARPHYRQAFEKIHLWHVSNAPDINENNFLMGLRGLETIYELCCLLTLNKVATKVLDFSLVSAKYIEYSETYSYAGRVGERPNSAINNHFEYSSGDVTLTLRYEPEIFQYRKGISLPGDLINTANRKRHSIHGEYRRCPDYVLRFESDSWHEPLVIIADAKYKNDENAAEYDLSSCEEKYLRDIFEVKPNGTIGVSPAKLMLILFAHGRDKTLSRLHKMHQIGGELPVYPQASGQKLTPHEEPMKKLAETILNVYCDHTNVSKIS